MHDKNFQKERTVKKSDRLPHSFTSLMRTATKKGAMMEELDMDPEKFEITLPSELRQVKLLIRTAMVCLPADSPSVQILTETATRISLLAEDADLYFFHLRERRSNARNAAAISKIRAIGHPRKRRRR